MEFGRAYDELDELMVSRENDNDGYDDFRGKKLFVTAVFRSEEENRYYDSSMQGMPLYELKTEDGKEIGSALYHYELEQYDDEE